MGVTSARWGRVKNTQVFPVKLTETSNAGQQFKKEHTTIIAFLDNSDITIVLREIKFYIDYNPLTFLVQCHCIPSVRSLNCQCRLSVAHGSSR